MAESVVLIDYGAGNLRSLANALALAGAGHVTVTADPAIVATAERIVLPGVGAFGACAAALRGVDGLVDALEQRVRGDAVPFLGICVGMQLLADAGEEHGHHAGLGWIGGTVRRLQPADPAAQLSGLPPTQALAAFPSVLPPAQALAVRVPHMGWNDVTASHAHPLIVPGEAYFLHGYHLSGCPANAVIATSDHGGPIIAAVAQGNIAGVQFHPEKSQRYGIAMLERFLAWRP